MSGIRVRLCPSPTGAPCIGLIRTALFDWAYARHTGGKLIFRIKDTDAARDSEESCQVIIEALDRLGIDQDKGIDVDGPHGLYRQPQCKDIYADILQRLIDVGGVYEALSAVEEAEECRRAAGRDPKLGYDNYDRNLTGEQREAFRAEGHKPVIRLRMSDEDVIFGNLVRGHIEFKAGLVPDFVTIHSNGEPLYTLVNLVDGALMEVTHVLRGEGLLPLTPHQIVPCESLKRTGVARFTPEFGHLPFVMGGGNKKLSKRGPQSNLFIHRDNGFIREGLLNYLVLLGWFMNGDQDIPMMDEMVKAFDVHDVPPSPARFDQKKANAVNADHIRTLDLKNFEQRPRTYLEGCFDFPIDYLADEFVFPATLPQIRVKTLSNAWDPSKFLVAGEDEFTSNEHSIRRNFKEDAAAVLETTTAAVEPLSEEDFVTGKLEVVFQKALIEDLELKPHRAFGPVCMTVAGVQVFPPLFEFVGPLDRSHSLDRLHKVFEVTPFTAAQ